MDNYHREWGWATKTGLDWIQKSPEKYHAWMTGKTKDDDTAAFRLGRIIHTAVLEPDKFEDKYFHLVEPAWGDCRNKDNKARRDAWRDEHPYYKSENNLDVKTWDTVRGIRDSVLSNPDVQAILLHGEPEKLHRWEMDGVKCKCRFDWINQDARIAADLKTTQDASEKEFAWKSMKYRYHVQQAFYTSDNLVDQFYFIAVEKEPPYPVAVWTLPLSILDDGKRLMAANLKTFKACLGADVWPGYQVRARELRDPRNRS